MSRPAVGTIHYLNADFDLSLRLHPRKLRQPSMQKAVRALTVQGLLAGTADDALLVRAGVPDEFIGYLSRQGIDAPRAVTSPDMERHMAFCPFGWSEEAVAINREQLRPSPHPSLEVVRRVNSRAFSSMLERESFDGDDAGCLFDSTGDLIRWLGEQGDSPLGWVVKANHGNAGLGNRRIRGRTLTAADRKVVDEILADDGKAVVEPWRRRVVDLCTVFTLTPSGEIRDRRGHETVYTAGGALVGALFDEGDRRRHDMVDGVVEVVAAELARHRYFGPVSFDSFLYGADGGERLRPLADLNCRRPMSDAIYPFRRDRLKGRTVYWRFFNTRKVSPDIVEELCASDLHFCPCLRRGVLLTSPLMVELDGVPQRAPKLAAAFIGETRAEVLEMEGAFRVRFER